MKKRVKYSLIILLAVILFVVIAGFFLLKNKPLLSPVIWWEIWGVGCLEDEPCPEEHCAVEIPQDYDGDGVLGVRVPVCLEYGKFSSLLKIFFGRLNEGDEDCRDDNSNIYPFAPENCDDTDNDCDGSPETYQGANIARFKEEKSAEEKIEICKETPQGASWTPIETVYDFNDKPLFFPGNRINTFKKIQRYLNRMGQSTEGVRISISPIIGPKKNIGAIFTINLEL